jgi:hypothetical protein
MVTVAPFVPVVVQTVAVVLANVTALPEPPPAALTVNAASPNVFGARAAKAIAWLALNDAVTDLVALIVTERVVVPVPSPLQLSNVDPAVVGSAALGVAVRVTVAPLTKLALHVPLVVPPVLVQLMPAGVLAIVPTPAPAPLMESVRVRGAVTTRVRSDVEAVSESWQPTPSLAVTLNV